MAQAIIFELTIRQSNVIDQWEPASKDEGGIIVNGKRWVVAEYPLLVQELERVPLDKRTGPIVLDESSGRPWFHRHFARKYREIAQAASVPDSIWSRDYRAGGITEAMDAGANSEQTRQHATHTDIKMTGRYNRGSEKQTAEVARVRAAWRSNHEKS
nr:hypothetical protein [uncultured Cohaesibacter sp.]